MRVRLVLDVLGGEVVRGVAGRRSAYRPVESVLTTSTDPRDVAAAFRDRLGVTSLYVADLDGLVDGRPDLGLLEALAGEGFDMVVDVGTRSLEEGVRVAESGVAGVVCALETLPAPADLARIVEVIGPGRAVFSLDLRRGEPLRTNDAWPAEALAVARLAIEAGVRRIIVLDLAAVGTGSGVPTLDLCGDVHLVDPGISLVTGGGVRTAADLARLADAGIDEALVASSVHDGRLTREALTAFR